MTRFGILLPRYEAGPEDVLEAARAAEEAGLHSVWTSDHLWDRPGTSVRPALEGWITLAAVAASTRRVAVGCLVLRVSQRRPGVLVAMVATAARIAPGRLRIGLGVGDGQARAEQRSYGIPFPSRPERLECLRATLHELRREVPEVPLWVGGSGFDILEVARDADGWSFWGPVSDFGAYRSRLAAGLEERMPETSWAGPFPGEEGVHELQEAGADEIVIAVGRGNYRERIEQLIEVGHRAGGRIPLGGI